MTAGWLHLPAKKLELLKELLVQWYLGQCVGD